MKRNKKQYLLLMAIAVMLISLTVLPGIMQAKAVELTLVAPEAMELVMSDSLSGVIEIDVIAGKYYDVVLFGSDISSFNGKEITARYDITELELIDLCSFTKKKELTEGTIPDMDLTIIQVADGEISFTVDKYIPVGKVWSGVLNIFKFEALKTGTVTIFVSDNSEADLSVPTTIEFTESEYTGNIPVSDETIMEVAAQVKDQYGNVMAECLPAYSISPAYNGVKIDSATGEITIQADAAEGAVNIIAKYGTLTDANITLTLSKAAPVATAIEFSQSAYSAAIPASANANITVEAQVKDQYGNVMSEIKPVYSLQNSYSGVSINSTTGVVTVQYNAAAGTVNIKATYGVLSATVPLTLTKVSTGITYTLVIENSYMYIDYGYEETAYIKAYVVNGQGQRVTSPELVSIEYETDYGIVNNTGVFTLEELEIYPYSKRGEATVTVRATLKDGTVLTESVTISTW